MKMEWIDWVALAFATYCFGDFVVALARERRAKREFRAWLEQMHRDHRGKLS